MMEMWKWGSLASKQSSMLIQETEGKKKIYENRGWKIWVFQQIRTCRIHVDGLQMTAEHLHPSR